MLNRYSTAEMRKLWSLEHKFEVWQKVELFACEYWAKQGRIPAKDWKSIREKIGFSTERVLELERSLHHDVVAFTTNLAENIGPSSRYVHFGLTSSDVVDTALSYTLKEAVELILERFDSFIQVLRKKALEYKGQLITGRTHGVHAEPTTLGFKFLGFLTEARRNYKRLEDAREECSFGKISGAVGTYSQLPPELESFVMERLGLKAEPVSTQVVPRDRHSHLLNQLALTAQGLGRFAQEIRLLQKTESREVEEPFQQGQKGSSAMPHKKNPILCERICGLGRVICGYASTSMNNILLWHERDISHSSAERVILPDATSLLEYMFIKAEFVLENLHVNAERCSHVLELTSGLLFSSRALLTIIEETDMTREDAYKIVQDSANEVWSSDSLHLKDVLVSHPELSKIPSKRWDEVFDPKDFLKNVDSVYERVLDNSF